MGDDMKRLRNEGQDPYNCHKIYIEDECPPGGNSLPMHNGVVITTSDRHVGNMHAGMGNRLISVGGSVSSGKSMLGAEAARTLKLMGLTARTNRDLDKIDPDYMYELINQLKTQLDRDKPNKKKANKIFNKLRAEIADNVVFFKNIAEDSDKLAKRNRLDDERLQKEIVQNTKHRRKIGDYQRDMKKLKTENAELIRKLACFEEDGEVAKIRSKLVNAVRKQT